MSKTIYNYNPGTYEFLGTSEARPSPHEPGVFLIPAHATEIEAPKFEKHEVAVFNPATQVWSIQPDYRNEKRYNTADGSEFLVSQIGPLDIVAPDTTGQPRPSPSHYYANGAWAPDIEKVRAGRSREISNACALDITGGFESNALGAPHHYPAKTTDQQNLSASVLDSLLPGLPGDWVTPFWCANEAGDWSFVPHTAVQIQQVGRDAKQAILTRMAKNEQLQQTIASATRVDQLAAISWDDE